MPTLPPDPHGLRDVARAFGEDAERYDRTRPRYPAALVGRIAARGADVLDVGTGTGIAARQFRAAGCRVLGVEVDERMADVARRGGLAVEVSAFESWDPAGRRFDAVVSGQSWHWLDQVAAAALRPGGRLAAFWNVHRPPPELTRAFAEVYRRAAPDLPFTPWAVPADDAYSAITDRATAGLAATGAFGQAEIWRDEWDHPYSRDEWLDQVLTHGGHSRIPPSTRAALLTGLAAAIDAVGGSFTVRYTTVTVTAERG